MGLTRGGAIWASRWKTQTFLISLTWIFEEVCRVLKARATVLDVKALSTEWQRQIAKQEPNIVQGISVAAFPFSVHLTVVGMSHVFEMPVLISYI